MGMTTQLTKSGLKVLHKVQIMPTVTVWARPLVIWLFENADGINPEEAAKLSKPYRYIDIDTIKLPIMGDTWLLNAKWNTGLKYHWEISVMDKSIALMIKLKWQ
jgi:hypothetical protein